MLPLDKPFYLYTLRGTSCQNVRGATVKEESVSLENTHGKYEIDMKGVNPFITDGNNSPAKITYCYYTPGMHAMNNVSTNILLSFYFLLSTFYTLGERLLGHLLD